MKLVCIPAHNEESHIENLVKLAKNYVDSVIVCDDCSTDDTANIAKKALADVNIDDAVKAAPVAVAAAPAADAAAAGGEAKKEEKPKDTGKTEEAAMEGLSSLFG